MNKDKIKYEIAEKVKLIDDALDRYLPGPEETPATVHQAMRYSVFAGGKRIRPVLFLASAEAVGGNSRKLLPAACALEMIHTYSLIHDDLPAMDNDDFRRGKPTNHRVYGEAIAVLAGDALLTLAFGLMAETCAAGNAAPEVVIEVIREVSMAAGSRGMIGGQVVDIQSENKKVDQQVLAYIHSHKTGALIRACVRTGAMMSGCSARQLENLTAYAENAGLAFQITDDILDIEGDTAKMGKTAGSDLRKKKSTYPGLYGMEEARRLAAISVDKALAALDSFGSEADTLRYIAGFFLERDR